MPTAFNAWTPSGTVVTSATKGYGNPTVLYDINPVILTGNTNVFKMWYGDYAAGVLYYAESVDGLTSWTQYSGNPISVPVGAVNPSGLCAFPVVWKVGSTYYLYLSPGNGNFATIVLYTSSDGVTWTYQGASLNRSGNAWDTTGVVQLHLCDIIGGTWYAYFTGFGGGVYAGGLATSTNSGLTWTNANLVAAITGLNGANCAGWSFIKVGSTYYGYGQGSSNNAAMQAAGGNSIYRWSSPSVTGPWTQLAVNGIQVATYYAATAADFSQFTIANQTADPSFLYVPSLGNCYLYYDVGTSGAEGTINQAVATGYTAAQLVATYEGVVGAPSSGNPQLNLTTLATDNFTRANANPIGGNWSPLTSSIVAQLLNNQATVAAAATSGDSYWNALTWPNDQWAQSTIAVVAAANADAGICLRMINTGVATEYRIQWGTTLGTSGPWIIKKLISGVATQLLTANLKVSLGDTLMGVINGTNIYLYWNGFLIGVTTDNAISSGSAGFEIFGTLVADVAISAWSGGSFKAAPPISSTGSGSMMMMGCGQ